MDCNRKPNTVCKLCNKPVYKRPKEIAKGNVFCSKACHGKSQRIIKLCSTCGKELPVHNNGHNRWKNQKYCSRECSNKSRIGLKYTGERKNDKYTRMEELRLQLAHANGGICSVCGNKNFAILEAHHKIPKSKGGSDSLDNLILLCKNCHGVSHKGYYTFEDFLAKELKEIKKTEDLADKKIKALEQKAQQIEKKKINKTRNKLIKQNQKSKRISAVNTCKVCNKLTSNKDYCSYICANQASRKFDPTKEELESLIAQYPMTAVGKMFGVSSNAIKRRAKLLGIEIPKRLGYWTKVKYNKV